MTDPNVPPAPGFPEPPKKKSKAKIFLIIGAVLLVVCCGGGFLAFKLFANKAVDLVYAEGNCIDTLPTSQTAQAVTPKPVQCSDSKAVAKILKVADGKTQADAESVCSAVPDTTSYIIITKTNGST